MCRPISATIPPSPCTRRSARAKTCCISTSSRLRTDRGRFHGRRWTSQANEDRERGVRRGSGFAVVLTAAQAGIENCQLALPGFRRRITFLARRGVVVEGRERVGEGKGGAQ